MKRKRILIGCLLLVAISFFVWWDNQPQRFLKNSDEFWLYSLDPIHKTDDKEKFHGYQVLGKTQISGFSERDFLINALFSSFITTDDRAACFFPRHGIRAIRRGHVFDIEICFECQDIYFYRDGKQLSDQPISLDAKELFNQTLRKYHLPLAKE